jgi:microcystin-dependent protein
MNLALPIPTVTDGPQYAQDITNNFSIIDNHDHTSGSGAQIPFNALTANQDLDLDDFGLTSASSLNLTNQVVSPSLSGSIYMSGNNLYFRDGTGAYNVQITNGNILNISGNYGFTGLPSGTASAAFLPGSGTFRLQSSTDTGAKLDVGPVIIRKQTALSNSITLVPANAIALDYTLTLPAATPSADSLVQSDNSGNLSFVPSTYLVPTGTVMMYAGNSAPSGWVLCDGSTYDSVTNPQYAALFAVLGTTFGGTGAASFKVPDCRGIFVRGAGSQTISGVSYSGTLGTTQGDTFQAHWHSVLGGAGYYGSDQIIRITSLNAAGGGSGRVAAPQDHGGLNYGNVTAQGAITDGVNGTPRTGTETKPANIGLTYIIKY